MLIICNLDFKRAPKRWKRRQHHHIGFRCVCVCVRHSIHKPKPYPKQSTNWVANDFPVIATETIGAKYPNKPGIWLVPSLQLSRSQVCFNVAKLLECTFHLLRSRSYRQKNARDHVKYAVSKCFKGRHETEPKRKTSQMDPNGGETDQISIDVQASKLYTMKGPNQLFLLDSHNLFFWWIVSQPWMSGLLTMWLKQS